MNRCARAARVLGLPTMQPGRSLRVATAAATVLSLVLGWAAPLEAASLSAAKVALSDPRPYPGSGTNGTNVTYTATVSSVSATALRCITATFVTTPSGSTAVPGMSASAATVNAGSTFLTSSSGSWATANTANQVKYTNTTNATAPSVTTNATFVMQAIQNGNTADTGYWMQFRTYSDSACTAPVDNTTVGFIYTTGSTLSLTVDGTLTFTVNAVASGQSCDGGTTTAASTATTIPFGTVTSAANGFVCQDLTAATNASNGYTIFARYTGAVTNGTGQTITDWTGTNGAPTTFPAAGTAEAYGYSTNDTTLTATGNGANRFTNGGQKFAGMSTTNAEVAYEAAGVTSTTYRLAHQVSLTTLTDPGVYSTTIVYTCTPVF